MPKGSRLISLHDAVARHVVPGLHLHFSSTPSRSNASILAVARAFRGSRPEFTLSTTGFHSLAHLLARLRLGRCFIACFYGDNYPEPRPNALYQTLLDEGSTLEHWSLSSYVAALRAGAQGHAYAVTSSLSGTTLGARLAARGRFVEVPDPREPERRVGLIAALNPDLVFLHASAATASGRAVFAPPSGEAFHAALAARVGVVVTTERVIDDAEADDLQDLLPLPAHRVLAVCEAPFGAHPQSMLGVPRRPDLPSYRDDYRHYRFWRELALDDAQFTEFEQSVLEMRDAAAAYRKFVGLEHLERLRGREREPAEASGLRLRSEPRTRDRELSPLERQLLLAGRFIARRVRARGYRAILAGIGRSFAAVRLAKLLLDTDDVEILVETGLAGVDPACADPFLLASENVARARHWSSIDVVLGTYACGAMNHCLAVIGGAQVDELGNVNSTCVDGRLLVGSGGANDLASSARDVVVLTLADPRRLVASVEHVTSAGARVSTVVTDRGVLERDSRHGPWSLHAGGFWGSELAGNCPWSVQLLPEPPGAPTLRELALLDRVVNPSGDLAGREVLRA